MSNLKIELAIKRINNILDIQEPFYGKVGAYTYEHNILGYQLQKYMNDSGSTLNKTTHIKSFSHFLELLDIFESGLIEMNNHIKTTISNINKF